MAEEDKELLDRMAAAAEGNAPVSADQGDVAPENIEPGGIIREPLGDLTEPARER